VSYFSCEVFAAEPRRSHAGLVVEIEQAQVTVEILKNGPAGP